MTMGQRGVERSGQASNMRPRLECGEKNKMEMEMETTRRSKQASRQRGREERAG